ncbi:hypothetical protein ACRAWF_43870 [Streptomyces sp. L7]
MPGSGSNLSAWHYITGEFRGRSFKCFEYRYSNPLSGSSGVGESKKLTIESIFLVSAPGSGPFLQIGRPGKLDAVLGRRPRTLMGITEFDEKFRVVTDDEDFARSILSDPMPAFLLADSRAQKSPLRLRDDELFTWYTGTAFPSGRRRAAGLSVRCARPDSRAGVGNHLTNPTLGGSLVRRFHRPEEFLVVADELVELIRFRREDDFDHGSLRRIPDVLHAEVHLTLTQLYGLSPQGGGEDEVLNDSGRVQSGPEYPVCRSRSS